MKPLKKNIVTKTKIKDLGLCASGWGRLCEAYPDQDDLTYQQIVESNGISDTFWLLRRTLGMEDFKSILLRFVLITEESLKYFEAKFPDDKRPHAVYDLIRRQIRGRTPR